MAFVVMKNVRPFKLTTGSPPAALSFSACALKNLTSPLCTSPYPRGITNLSWIHPGNCALTPSGGIRPCKQNTTSV